MKYLLFYLFCGMALAMNIVLIIYNIIRFYNL